VNPNVLKTSVDSGIAVVTLGSAQRIVLDEEMTDALTTALEELAGNPRVRVVVLTGGAPGYFIRHYSIASLLRFAEAVRNSGREWADNATYHGGFIDRAIGLCETMAKPTIAAISGTALAGAFELTLPAISGSPRTASTL
jgi:enoyl-CoA hydratase/carnithine racemase